MEREIEQQCELDNITYNWHLTHIAIAMVESDYNSYAEQFWLRILDRFSPVEKFQCSPEYRRIHSLVVNSINELSVMYYNQGKQEEWQNYSRLIHSKRSNLCTGSKYFETQLAQASLGIFNPDWNGKVIFSFARVFNFLLKDHFLLTH